MDYSETTSYRLPTEELPLHPRPVLITGSSGFVGSALKRALKKANIPFHVVDRVPVGENTFVAQRGAWQVSWPTGLSSLPYQNYCAVIHLALSQPAPSDSQEAAVEKHLTPLRRIIEGLERAHGETPLLFVSSQAASNTASSDYGRGKHASEELLRPLSLPWTIIRPGLIIGPGGKGLFNRIKRVLEKVPVIPVPAGGPMQIQPVLLSDVVAACIKIITEPERHRHHCYDLGLPARSFPEFIREVCALLGLRRVVLPIPWQLISLALRVCESLPLSLPVSRKSLEGLLGASVLDSSALPHSLGIELHHPTRGALREEPETPLEREAFFLFRALFPGEPPLEVVERYCEAQKPELLTGAWIDLEKIIEKNLDSEAIELAVRRKKTVLTQKIEILVYLCELSPSLLPVFMNSRNQRVWGILALGWNTLSSGWKFLLGAYLVRKHHLLGDPTLTKPTPTHAQTPRRSP